MTDTRSSHPVVFLEKSVMEICSKFTGEHSCWSVISIKSLCNFFEIALQHECSPVNLLHIFRTPFPRNTSGRLLLRNIDYISNIAHFINFWQKAIYIWNKVHSSFLLKICCIFSEHLFLGTPLDGCFWDILIIFAIQNTLSTFDKRVFTFE